jgi:4-hydroxy-tetrahydrodipicolinate synthase
MAGGVAFGKAALRLTGLDVGDPRLPQIAADSDHITAIASALAEAGVLT